MRLDEFKQAQMEEIMEWAVYLDEVVGLEAAERGRPKLKEKDDWFKTGDTVIWNLMPRGGYGFTVPIVAAVVKTSAKKIQLQFTGGDNTKYFAWANRSDCKNFEGGQVDNNLAPESGIVSSYQYYTMENKLDEAR